MSSITTPFLHRRTMTTPGIILGAAIMLLSVAVQATGSEAIFRVATFNVADVRTEQLLINTDPRLKEVASIIQRVRPDVILLNEIAFDESLPTSGQNGQRFADRYLAVPQRDGLSPLSYRSFMAPSNTGIHSGFDLNRDGQVVTDCDIVISSGLTPDRSAAERGRAYGNDCWGYGTFPGQYAMALLVREGWTLDTERIRTFQHFRWSRMPGALKPQDPLTGTSWYDIHVWDTFPLSSKSHWDVPVRLPGGQVVHFLCSHPTPPVFDGEEDRNGCRNHDEIRFWSEYLQGADWIVDDSGRSGSLADDALFVIVGDLNADPLKGDARNNPVGTHLLSHPRIRGDFVPTASGPTIGLSGRPLDSADTARWGLRVDYVLPAHTLHIVDGGVARHDVDGATPPSDHFLVWLDLKLP